MNYLNRWIIIFVISTTMMIANAGLVKREDTLGESAEENKIYQTQPNVKVAKKQGVDESDECGEPKPTYVTWKDLRHYLVRWSKVSVPGDYEGPPLQVMRCNNALSPCNEGDNKCCGVVEETVTTKNLTIQTKVNGNKNLELLYLEHRKCGCVNEKRYKLIKVEVDDVPYIYEANFIA